MFTLSNPPSKSQRVSRYGSIAVHCVLLYFVLRSPNPIFVRPSGILYGKHGTATQLIYLPRMGSDTSQSSSADATQKLIFPKPAAKTKSQKSEIASVRADRIQPTSQQASLAGSPMGSLSSGPVSGHEVRPAFPVVFPDPIVARSEIPSGVAGDVIVEVTIDERGTVTATRVLQPFGYGIEDKVLAVLRNWRFAPATMDGVAIPSQQDVHFHFPS